jgi:hypothetical protein
LINGICNQCLPCRVNNHHNNNENLILASHVKIDL